MLATCEPVVLGGRLDPADVAFLTLKKRVDRHWSAIDDIDLSDPSYGPRCDEGCVMERELTRLPVRSLPALKLKYAHLLDLLEADAGPVDPDGPDLHIALARSIAADLDALS